MDEKNNYQNQKGINKKVFLIGGLLIASATFTVINILSLFILNVKMGYILIVISVVSLLIIVTCIYLV